MNCHVCHDRGMVVANWADAQCDYAVCLCAAGRVMRTTMNIRETGIALWQVWAAREQVDAARIYLLEEVLTPEELQRAGFSQPARAESREAALLAAGRTKKARL